MKSEMILAAALVAMLLLAGCAYFPQGEEVNLGFRGTLNASASGFQMEGNLSTGGGIPDREVYRDVTIILYSAEGVVIHRENLGDMRTDRRFAISIAIDTIPHYVVFDSPDFWQDSMQVEYYVKMDSKYGVEYATEREDLPSKTTS